MSFAGHVLDMIRRQKQNRALQKHRREEFVEKREVIKSKLTRKKSNFEIEANRKIINLQIKSENQIVWVKTLIVLILCSLLYYIVNFFRS